VTTTVLADIAALGTFLGVLFAGAQLVYNRRQARTQFEDSLTAAYRELTAELPIDVFLDGPIAREVVAAHRSVFYRYFDLCNEQVFLHDQGRISDATWTQWRDGIEGNFARPAFRAAWFDDIAPHVGSDFQELRRIVDTFPQPR
jgi:hypothetical protein